MQEELLKTHKLRTTSSRAAILGIFFNQQHALSYSDIEKEVSASYDRVTVYRTLKSFLDKGVIHKVLDDSGTLKYALCNDHCSTVEHHHDHVHFKCTKCSFQLNADLNASRNIRDKLLDAIRSPERASVNRHLSK